MSVFYFLSALKLKIPANAVIKIGSAHPHEGQTGWLKRCTYIRKAIQESATTRKAGGLDFTVIGGKRQGR